MWFKIVDVIIDHALLSSLWGSVIAKTKINATIGISVFSQLSPKFHMSVFNFFFVLDKLILNFFMVILCLYMLNFTDIYCLQCLQFEDDDKRVHMDLKYSFEIKKKS